MGSSMIKEPGSYNTVFHFTEIWWNKISELQKGTKIPRFNFDFINKIEVKM